MRKKTTAVKEERNENTMENVAGNIMKMYCPEKYRGQMFLTAQDVQEMLMLGENKTYEFLKDAPFRVVRIGCQLRVVTVSFWKWYGEGV